jgi:hypothetical protein
MDTAEYFLVLRILSWKPRPTGVHMRLKDDFCLALGICTGVGPSHDFCLALGICMGVGPCHCADLYHIDMQCVFTRRNRGCVCCVPVCVTRYCCHHRRIPFKLHGFIKLMLFCFNFCWHVSRELLYPPYCFCSSLSLNLGRSFILFL